MLCNGGEIKTFLLLCSEERMEGTLVEENVVLRSNISEVRLRSLGNSRRAV